MHDTATRPPDPQDGRTWRLPPGRRLVNDLLALSQRTPRCPELRHCRIPRLAEAQAKTLRTARIGWPVLFMKAYANVCARRPELRRLILPRPWTRIYQHPTSICRMTVARERDGEQTVVMTKTFDVEKHSLAELQAEIREMATGSPQEVPLLKKQWRFARWPGFLRRLCWYIGENFGGRTRAYWLGTYLVTTVSHYGAIALSPPVISNATLSFGRVSGEGDVDVVLNYDHRLVDGVAVALALAELEKELDGPICDELLALAEESSRPAQRERSPDPGRPAPRRTVTMTTTPVPATAATAPSYQEAAS